MVTARRIDKLELELKTTVVRAFFHVSGAGHEGTAILASLLHARIGCSAIIATKR